MEVETSEPEVYTVRIHAYNAYDHKKRVSVSVMYIYICLYRRMYISIYGSTCIYTYTGGCQNDVPLWGTAYHVPYYTKDPKRDHNSDNHPYCTPFNPGDPISPKQVMFIYTLGP